MLLPIERRNERRGCRFRFKMMLFLSVSLVALPVAAQTLWPARRSATEGWSVRELVAHLRSQGIDLHLIPAAAHGDLEDGLYLTEDSKATWESLQRKPRLPERIAVWQGTVWVGRVPRYVDLPALLAFWEPNGCRCGDFLLFGDDRLRERIVEALR